MNTRAMVARLNELDEQLCSAFGIARSVDATTLDEAITMSASTTEHLVAGERGARDDAGSVVRRSPLTDFLQAQVAARQMRASDRADVVRSLTAACRRIATMCLVDISFNPARANVKGSLRASRASRSPDVVSSVARGRLRFARGLRHVSRAAVG